MLVILMLKDKLIKMNLPNKINGNYILKENEKNYINIEGVDSSWRIKSNKNVRILKTEKEIYNEVILEKNSFYVLNFSKTNTKGFIYCTDIYDMTFTQFNIVSNISEIIINNTENSSIQYKTNIINGQNYKITIKNRKWTFEVNNNSTAYINEKIVKGSQVLVNGDVIFIYGLKIIYLENTLFINNPNNSVVTNQYFLPIKKEKAVPFVEDSDEIEMEETDEKFFLRAPNIRGVIERKTINIDAPPAEEKEDDTPIAYVVGPMLSMGMVSVATMFSALMSYTAGGRSFSSIVPSLVISAAMLSGILIWPILSRRYQNKKKRKLEKKRQERYSKYIDKKAKEIDEIMLEQRKILSENYPDPKECERIIIKKDMRLFERRIDNQDFLTVRLGLGTLPLDIDIRYPEEHFTMEDDYLVGVLNNLVEKSKMLDNVSIPYSFVKNKISAIIDEKDIIKKNNFLHNLLIQLTTFHSYDELKIVFLLKEDTDIDINYVKMLPHVWNNSKSFRFVATNVDEMKEVSLYLEEILQNRLNRENDHTSKKNYKDYDNYYLIITDDYKSASNLQIVSDLLKFEENQGFSLLFITESINDLPNECTDFIELKEKECTIFTSELSVSQQLKFDIQKYDLVNFYDATKVLNNIKMRLAKGSYVLPDSYDFLEMYDVSKVDQLNCLERWKINDSTLSLSSMLGIDSSHEAVYLDIHEKAHGPHGLIAGMTGSGKSEFIITFILSMAINYHPYDVNFILIDYKGGSLAGAFHNSGLGVKLPHLVGTITNLDKNEMDRSLASIQSELNRRQKIFNETRARLDEGTIDIYKYQKLYHDGVVKEPVSHLIIISDEFAELKTQQPEFMEQLIRVARIGRSLGVHLILATQRPSGIVNDQIRSNSRFSVCLKVQDRSDSIDMIDRPDAAALKQAGRFYLQVVYNEYFTMGQAAWSGAPYLPSDKIVKKVDTNISFVSNLGKVIKQVNNIKPISINSEGEQLNSVIKYLSNLAVSEKIFTRKMWLDKIPNIIYLQNLREKYQYKYIYNHIEPIIGEYDDPSNQSQGILTLPISKEGNAILYGAADSGKELFLSTMIYDLITSHHTNELNMYIFDFGSETLKKYISAPQVGDVIISNNAEKVVNFFFVIKQEIERRKKIISNSLDDTVADQFPMILVIFNNYEVFKENYGDFEEVLYNITRDSIRYKVNFIFTANASNTIRYRLQQNFKIKIALQLNDDSDYRSVLEGARKKRPSHIYGRGLVELNDTAYEFQTAYICEKEKLNNYLDMTFDKLKQLEKTSAKPVPVLPSVVKTEDVIGVMNDLSNVPVGIAKFDLKVETYDFKTNFSNLILGRRIDVVAMYIYNLFNMISSLTDVNAVVVDDNNFYKDSECKFTYIDSSGQINNNFGKKHNIICFIGVDSLKQYADNNKKPIEEFLESLTNQKNYSIIIADDMQQIKASEYEKWYKKYIGNLQGLWIGSGVSDQYSLKINQSGSRLDNNCDIDFGYVVKNGNAKFIKLLEMRSDNNE